MFWPINYDFLLHTDVMSDGSGFGLTQKSNNRKVKEAIYIKLKQRVPTMNRDQGYHLYIFDSGKNIYVITSSFVAQSIFLDKQTQINIISLWTYAGYIKTH